MYKIIVFIHKVTEIQRRKKFSILCFTQQMVIEPEGVLNRYVLFIVFSKMADNKENNKQKYMQ